MILRLLPLALLLTLGCDQCPNPTYTESMEMRAGACTVDGRVGRRLNVELSGGVCVAMCQMAETPAEVRARAALYFGEGSLVPVGDAGVAP